MVSLKRQLPNSFNIKYMSRDFYFSRQLKCYMSASHSDEDKLSNWTPKIISASRMFAETTTYDCERAWLLTKSGEDVVYESTRQLQTHLNCWLPGIWCPPTAGTKFSGVTWQQRGEWTLSHWITMWNITS